MDTLTGYYYPTQPTPEQVEQNRTRVVPTGSRAWSIVNDDRVIATADRRDDADLIASGLRALRREQCLLNQIFELQDCIQDLTERRQS